MALCMLVGYWNEAESRRLERCPSYYAADYEVLETRPGRYPVYMDWRSGFTCPMAGDFGAAISADRVGGETYSGCGGVNYSSRPLDLGPAPYHVHLYQFQASAAVADGRIEPLPGREWLFDSDYKRVVAKCRDMTWEDVADGATEYVHLEAATV